LFEYLSKKIKGNQTMPRGGKRDNAGRKAGAATRRTQRTLEIAQQAAANGETPLDYMLRVMRDPSADYDRRDDMAKAAAAYVHPKLTATQVTGKDGAAIEVTWLPGA
jgi:hypothetical protein